MLSKNVIYGLIDPNTKELRYVGYSSNIDRRLKEHHRGCYLKNNSHKNNWIKSLLAKGQKAELIIIEEYETEEELPQAEIDMIAYYRFIGCDLTNTTDGGDGRKGYKHSEETKNKISKRHKGRIAWNKGIKHSDETKRKIYESGKRRYMLERQ